MKVTPQIFLFGIVFIYIFFMTFSVIRKMQSPVFKSGLDESSKIMVRNLN